METQKEILAALTEFARTYKRTAKVIYFYGNYQMLVPRYYAYLARPKWVRVPIEVGQTPSIARCVIARYFATNR